MTSVGSLEEEAAKRRERLKAMRDKSQQKGEGDAKKQKTDDDDSVALPKPVFRSYKPKDETLQVGVKCLDAWRGCLTVNLFAACDVGV